MVLLGHFYRLLIFLMFILISNSLLAQRLQPNRWYIAADGGVSVFFGDVKRYEYVPDINSPSEIQPMFSGSVGKEISKVFSLRGQFLYGGLSGHKKSAHYNFSSFLLGAHLMTDINLVYLMTNARFGKSRLNVLASLGGGYMQWNTTLYYDTPQKDGTDIMNKSNDGDFSFPGALSVEYLLSKSISINAQGMLYVIASDEVDAKPGGIKLDLVNYYGFGLTYKINSKRKAKRKEINYRLDASLYEPLPSDDPILVNEEKQKETVISTEKADNDSEDSQIVLNQEAIEYPIDHELEKAAIEKELWTPRDEEAWPDIVFSVQVLASKAYKEPKDIQDKLGIEQRIYVKEGSDGLYKYLVGKYDKLWRAKESRNIMRSKESIEGAFIVVYRNNERISLEEAMNYTARKQLVIAQPEEVNNSDKNAEKVYPLVSLVDNIPQEGTYIGVQILSMKSKNYPMGVFKGIYNIDRPIMIKYQDPWYKLIVYKFSTLNEAYDYQQKLRNKGFIDAFVLIFKDGRRISMKKYKELQNN